MMEKKQMRIELTGADAEKILTEWVSARMAEQGYKLDYSSRVVDGVWSDSFWRGDETPKARHKPASQEVFLTDSSWYAS